MTQILLPRLASIEELRQDVLEVDVLEDSPQQNVPEDILKAITILREHQNMVPVEVRIPLIQDILRNEYNLGLTTFKSDLELLRRRNPVALKVFWTILEAVCMQEGLRVIRDQPVQEYTQREKTKLKIPAWKRWLRNKVLDEQQKTAQLIQEAIQLASDNDVLKRENADLRARNQALDKEVSIRLEKAEHKAQQVVETAQTCADKKTREINIEIARKEANVFRLENKIKYLTGCKEKLMQDPKIAEVTLIDNKKYEETLINHMRGLSSFDICYRSVSNGGDAMFALQQLLTFFIKKICSRLEEIEAESGVAIRIEVATKILDSIPKFSMELIPHASSAPVKIFSSSLLSDMVSGFTQENVELRIVREKVEACIVELKNHKDQVTTTTMIIIRDTTWNSVLSYYREKSAE